jgi:outer membrane receptor protein involved in Fe transport
LLSGFFALSLLLFCAVEATAQTTARVEGTVADGTGAPLPGVTVSATNTRTNAVRTDVSDAHGSYTITALTVGEYKISAELSGFKSQVTPVTLTVGQVARVDFKLTVGNVSEAITVTAAAPLVEKSTSEISTLIDSKQIENLPLNGRNFTQLATLVPGVNRGIEGSNASGQSGQTETFRYAEFGGAALSVNGLREQFNNFMIDGIDNNETLVNSIAYLPPPDAIREFSVITTNAPAEYGRAGGAVQNLVIKSGTNDLGGTLDYFDRPKSTAAKPKFATTKPDFNNRDFGGTIGGPILHDRLFFFASYHGLRNSIPVETGNFVTVPTDKMRNGDFSELLSTDPNICIKDGTGKCMQVIIYNPSTGQPFANNMIPPGMINPVGKAYLNAFPHASNNAILHNFLTHRQKKSTYDDFDGRFDHYIAAGDQLFLSTSHWSDGFSDPGRIPGYQAGFGSGAAKNDGFTGRVGETHIFNANLINEARGGYTNFHYAFLPVGYGTDQNKALGIPGIAGVTTPNGISLIGGGDGTYIEYLGDFGQYNIGQRTVQFSDSVTWLKGDHAFKFGGTAMRRSLQEQRTQFGKGFYFFRDSFGFAPGYTGYEVADMLIGHTTFTTSANPGFVPRTVRSWENALFAQDDWRVNPKLTLNLGLRWDLLTPYYEANDKLANYDPATGQLVVAGQNGASRSTLKTNYDNFGPRFGFSYALDEKTAIRGAFGIFYSLDRGGIDRQLTENPPAVVTEFRFSDANCLPAGSCVSLSQPIPLPTPVNPSSPSLPAGSALVYIPKDSKNTSVTQWNIGAQRELTSNTSAMVAYVGNHAYHLAALLSSAGFSGDIGSRLSTTEYIGSSNYNALQATLRRTSASLSYLISATVGHATNNAVGYFPGGPSNGNALTSDPNCATPGKPCNINLDKGSADFDARHRLTAAATWAIPFATGNPVLGGWKLNAVHTYQSGTPFTVFDGSGKRLDQLGDPGEPHSTDMWFNTAAFRPTTATQGSEKRNSLRGPGTNLTDLSLFKTFPVPGKGSIDLRFEVFNVFNKAQYNLPGQVYGNPNFGKITGTQLNTERQVQFGVRYAF